MARPRRKVPVVRCNMSIPVTDTQTRAWLDAQKSPSDSVRYLIAAYVRSYGMTDPILTFPMFGMAAAGQGQPVQQAPAAQESREAAMEAPVEPRRQERPRQEAAYGNDGHWQGRDVGMPRQEPAERPPEPRSAPVPEPPQAPVQAPQQGGQSAGSDIVTRFFD